MQPCFLKTLPEQAMIGSWILAAGDQGQTLTIPPGWDSTHLVVGVDGGAEVEFFDQAGKLIPVPRRVNGAFVYAVLPAGTKAITPKAKAGAWTVKPVSRVEVRIQAADKAAAMFRTPNRPGAYAPITA